MTTEGALECILTIISKESTGVASEVRAAVKEVLEVLYDEAYEGAWEDVPSECEYCGAAIEP